MGDDDDDDDDGDAVMLLTFVESYFFSCATFSLS